MFGSALTQRSFFRASVIACFAPIVAGCSGSGTAVTPPTVSGGLAIVATAAPDGTSMQSATMVSVDGKRKPRQDPTPTPAPTATPSLPTVTAMNASAFVSGVGINMHNSFYGTGYTNNVSLVESLVEALGVGTVRDGMALGQTNVCQEDAALGAAGIHFDFIASPTASATDLKNWLACVGPQYVASVEGPNEYDISHPQSDPNWAQTLRNEQQLIFSTLRAQDPGVSVVGPAVTSASAAQQVGNLSAVLDEGNAHIYFNGYNPGNSGYGDGGYGSIGYGLSAVAPISGSKPMFVTESGYGTASGQLSEAAQAKYMPRLLLDMANAGVPETISYELIDEGGAPFSNYGLLRSDLSAKPAYFAVQSLLALLKDNGSSSGTLAMQVSGQTQNVETALFRKSNGSYALAIWLEVESCNPNTGADVTVPPQNVTLQFARTLSTPSLYTYDDALKLVGVPLPAERTIPLVVSDRVQVVTFR